MIIEFILNLVVQLVYWLIDLIPQANFEMPTLTVPILQFFQNVKEYLNFFLGSFSANIIIRLITTGPIAVMAFALIKLIRYFLPL